MKLKINRSQKKDGYALMLTLFFSGISLMALAGALQWTSSTARITDRNNRYFATAAAAEAATEKALANVCFDFQMAGEGPLYDHLDKYRLAVPSVAEDSYWGQFAFSDGQGNANQTYISRIQTWAYTQLESQYRGLYGMAATYRVVSNARALDMEPPMVAGIKQEVQVAAIPIFQFAIFYTMDLEINPDPTMNINGRVHSNAKIYNNAQGQVTYQSDVTAAGDIIFNRSPLDPTFRGSPRTPIFQAEHDANANSLMLPIGTNNTPEAVHAVIEIPPASEAANSLIGMQRYYNKADMVILVTDAGITAKSGNWDSFKTPLPSVNAFISTNASFTDKREGKSVKVTDIDVGNLVKWSTTNIAFTSLLGRDLNSIYVADLRSPGPLGETGVRIVNGQTLPSKGLTIATPNGAYVRGNFNAPAADLGTTNTLSTKPSSIVADSISIQSEGWDDAKADNGVWDRAAKNTTINAAFLAGIVPSNGFRYSGGVENFPRFMEDWSSSTLTYNGSMVVMFPSKTAIGMWGNSDVYKPPKRNWAFDLNFMDPLKLPPGTPMILATIRAKWAMVAPNDVL